MSTSLTTCTRRLEFDAAHRVPGHENKCKHLHGHRYAVEATFSAETLDGIGRVIDFGAVRTQLGAWLDAQWDHNVILWEGDRALGDAIAAATGQSVFYLPTPPTAECMAAYLLDTICVQLFNQSGLRCIAVRVWETPNCWADAARACSI